MYAIFGDNPSTSLLRNIYENESDIFEELGKSNGNINLIFFASKKSEWKIIYSANEIKSSRFATITALKHKYCSKDRKDLQLRAVIYYLLGEIKEKDGKLNLSKILASNEAKRFLNNILHGKQIDRNLFFLRSMNIYVHNYHQDRKSLYSVHKIYNFLADCGCLENGWQVPIHKIGEENMSTYKSTDEFFEANKAFFNNDIKKAWFLLGRLYDAMIWESKKYHKQSKEVEGEAKQYNASYLENNFFFGRKYDWDTFVYFANQCFDLSVKYNAIHKRYIREPRAQLKEYMAQEDVKRGELSPEEAKYIFAWGMDQWFELDKKEKTVDEENNTESDE
jgi:CRISPR-associated protein Csh1